MSNDDKTDPPVSPGETSPSQVRFEYIKSPSFRVLHVDGAWGGLTPKGLMSIAVYSERLPIPQVTVQAVNSDGSLGNELVKERVIRNAVVRELEAELMMDLATAETLYRWLGEKLQQAVKIFNLEHKEGSET